MGTLRASGPKRRDALSQLAERRFVHHPEEMK
jgi:hypothetical protein